MLHLCYIMYTFVETKVKDMAKKFSSIRVSEELAEELRIWKMAFERSYNRGSLTYEFILRGMLDSLEDTEPAVVEELDRMCKEDPSLLLKVCSHRVNCKS